MSNFTKGPWHTFEHSWSCTSVYAGDKRIAVLDITDTATEENEDEVGAGMAANGRLIAAAPELLAALIALHQVASVERDEDYGAISNAAAAAIAKATGEDHAQD